MTRLLVAVGCDQYEHLNGLSGAEADARATFEILTGSTGEYVREESKLLLSPSLGELRAILNSTLFAHQPIEVLTLFFAGHGAVKSGTYYLCMKDTHPDRLSITGFSLVQLFTIINECSPQQVNVIIDACQSGGAMFDISLFSKSEIVGEANSLSVSFLAACAPDQYAYEDSITQSGVATNELLKYLRGEAVLQHTRPFLDLVELGRAVSTTVSGNRADQTPVAWGLNLYGQGRFAKNPHYDGEEVEFPLRVARIPPNSDIGRKIQQYSKRLWDEYRDIVGTSSYRGLLNLLSTVCADLEANGESCLPFLRGIATSLRARAGSSRNLYAESEILACCAIAVLPFIQTDEAKLYAREILAELAKTNKQTKRLLLQNLHVDSYALINPVDAGSDFYFLPIRVSKILGWMGVDIIIDDLLGIQDSELQDSVRQLGEIVLAHYQHSLAAVSDSQAPYVYLFIKGCEVYEWNDLAQNVLQKYFESLLSIQGAVSRGDLTAEETFTYTVLRGLGLVQEEHRFLASPSDFIANLLLCGKSFGLSDDWNNHLIELDHKTVNFFLPNNYLTFGAEKIDNGENYSYQIGHGVWTLEDLERIFENFCQPKLVGNETIALAETKAICVLSSCLFPDRIPYFLERDF